MHNYCDIYNTLQGCLQSLPPKPEGQLHLPSYSEQLAKCRHSNPGNIQLKHGGQSLSLSLKISKVDLMFGVFTFKPV